VSLFRRRRVGGRLVSCDDDGTLATIVEAYDVTRGDATAVALLPLGQPVLVRHVFTGVEPADHPRLVELLAQDGWSAGPVEPDGRVVARGTRLLSPLMAAQTRARMTGLEMRLGLRYAGWEAAAPPR